MNEILESGVDAIFATSLMQKLGLSSADLMFPQNVANFQAVAGFLSKHPDPSLLLSRAKMLTTTQDGGERLRYLTEYVGLHRARKEIEEKLSSLNEQITAYER